MGPYTLVKIATDSGTYPEDRINVISNHDSLAEAEEAAGKLHETGDYAILKWMREGIVVEQIPATTVVRKGNATTKRNRRSEPEA